VKARVLTLPFDPGLGRFDDEAIRNLLTGKELVELRDS
jgi:hypothetical protein